MKFRGIKGALLLVAVAAPVAWLAWTGARARPALDPVFALIRRERWEDAEARVRAYLRSEPADPRANLLLAELALRRLDRPGGDDASSAREALEHARAVRGGDKALRARARLVEGSLCERLGRLDEAEAAWEEGCRLDPSSDAGWRLLALYDDQARRREGRALAFRLYRLCPQPSDKKRALIELIREDVHQPAAAGLIARLGPVLAAHPDEWHARLALGRALAREGRADEALKLLRQAMAERPHDEDAWDALLTALEDAGLVDALSRMLAATPLRSSQSAALARHDGWLAQERGDWEAAARAYRLARSSGERDAKLGYRLGRVLRLAGKAAEAEPIEAEVRAQETARRELRQLYERHEPELRADESHDDLYQQIADLRARMGRPGEALAWHALVLRHDPTNAVSAAAIERIKDQ